jgi:hypothetical protein
VKSGLAQLRKLGNKLRTGLKDLGYETIMGDHPIVPIFLRDTEKTAALVAHLFADNYQLEQIESRPLSGTDVESEGVAGTDLDHGGEAQLLRVSDIPGTTSPLFFHSGLYIQ